MAFAGIEFRFRSSELPAIVHASDARLLEKATTRGLALATIGVCVQVVSSAQMTGPHAINVDSMHTTQPICNGEKNDGIDIAAPVGTPVNAPMDGVVTARWNDKVYGCGLTLMIAARDGSVAGLSWLSATSVKIGERVLQGEEVGVSGQTGDASKPAIHFTLWTKEEGKVDPKTRVKPKLDPSSIELTDPSVLQRALDSNAASDNPDYIKENVRKALIEKFYKDRSLVATKYKDNLDKATNSWYANGKLWRKIPADIWAKLNEADKGRFKSGIDPETVAGR